MVHLTVTGLSKDGTKLLLVSQAGVEFSIDVDARLRAALRGDQARLGQLEIQMDSTLRPRDIQARIRAGESPETVAQVAGTSVEKVMPYAAPVLAERAHVAERAQRASVRRRPSEGTGAGSGRTLGEAVGFHLRSRNVDPDTVTWDAWRREDGRWTLTGSYAAAARVGAAHFSFDAPGNYVVADDEDAHWLLGELADEPASAAPAASAPDDLARDDLPRDDLQGARRRRLSAVPPEELPLGEDAIELVTGADEDALGTEQPLEAYLDDDTAMDDTAMDDTAMDDTAMDDTAMDDTATTPAVPGTDADSDAGAEAEEEPAPEPPARKQVKKTRGRASVPSWDEIMFGGGDSPKA